MKLIAFKDAAIIYPASITGGGSSSKDCGCGKANNGIGQEKRGIDDGTPPGLIKNGKGEFNDGDDNRHGVEVD